MVPLDVQNLREEAAGRLVHRGQLQHLEVAAYLGGFTRGDDAFPGIQLGPVDSHVGEVHGPTPQFQYARRQTGQMMLLVCVKVVEPMGGGGRGILGLRRQRPVEESLFLFRSPEILQT